MVAMASQGDVGARTSGRGEGVHIGGARLLYQLRDRVGWTPTHVVRNQDGQPSCPFYRTLRLTEMYRQRYTAG